MKTPDSSFFVTRIRYLSYALIVSGALNIGVLLLFLYGEFHERPPTPYFELKPASYEQQQIPLADDRESRQVIAQLAPLPYSELVSRLSQAQMIENGFAERDLALACLVAFHHFDLERALPKNAQPQQKRFLSWKSKSQDAPVTLVVYPDLTTQHFESIIHFAKKERWPFTAEGLFSLLKNQKEKTEANLKETFLLTPEFWTVELLFQRANQQVSKQDIMTLLLEGNWKMLKAFVDQQRKLHDPSDARRQRLLLDYLQAGSSSAAALLVKTEWDFATKKLDDEQVVVLLQRMPITAPEGERFAKEMLLSPRDTRVWKQASEWLYRKVGEQMPKLWDRQMAIARFSPTPFVQQVQQGAPIAQIAKKESDNKPVVPEKRSRQQTYIVQEGDSLWKISKRFNVSIDTLKAANRLTSDNLKPGLELKIPEKVL